MRWNLCRICLAGNAETVLTNAHFQDFYKSLTGKQWNKKQRPDTICYICLSLLRRCLKLREMSKQTEDIFSQFFAGGFEFTEETAPMLTERKLHQLLVTPVVNFTLDKTSDDVDEISLEGNGPFELIEIIPDNSFEEYLEQKDTQKLSTKQQEMAKDEDENEGQLEERTQLAGPLVCNTKVTDKMIGNTTKCTADKDEQNDSRISENSNSSFKLRFNLSNTNNDMKNVRKSKYDLFKNLITKAADSQSSYGSREKTFSCEVCEKTFYMKSYLTQHKKIHERPHACNLCTKRFDSWKQLDKHVRNHSNKEQYVCSICEKSFRQLSNLQQHTRLHTGETPYSCDLCGKKFKQKSNLLQHNRTHTKEKPYSCNMCSKSFSQLSNLTQHTRVLHKR